VLVEAQASGLPIVATRVGGIPEIVGDDGLIAEPESADAFAAQVVTALERLHEFDRTLIAARARRRFDLEPVGATFAEIYRWALRWTP
jgi:glycosyltransferase involved in cell wall biosynthesis